MKGLLRTYLFYLLALWLTKTIFTPSIITPTDLQVWLIAAGVLALLNMLVKPVLNILFLPVNAVTLGLFSIVINAAIFFAFLRLFPQFQVEAWVFPGFTFQSLHLPQTPIPKLGTLFAASTTISAISKLCAFLVE